MAQSYHCYSIVFIFLLTYPSWCRKNISQFFKLGWNILWANILDKYDDGYRSSLNMRILDKFDFVKSFLIWTWAFSYVTRHKWRIMRNSNICNFDDFFQILPEWIYGPVMIGVCLDINCWSFVPILLIVDRDITKIIKIKKHFLVWGWGGAGVRHGLLCHDMTVTHRHYRKTSSISRTKFQSLNVACVLLQLSSLNPLKPGVKLRMKM